jgi:hypothetical protein
MEQNQAEKAAPAPRPKKEIDAEYKFLAQLAGDKDYRCDVLIQERAQIKQRMLELNQELQATNALSAPPAPAPETPA